MSLGYTSSRKLVEVIVDGFSECGSYNPKMSEMCKN